MTRALILVGSLPPPVGGTTVLFESLVIAAATSEDVCVLPLKRTPLGAIGLFSRFFVARCRYASGSLVSIHCSARSAMRIAPYLTILARALGFRVSLRVFGGDADIEYERLSQFKKRIFRIGIAASTGMFLETRHLVGRFIGSVGEDKVRWFPNYRPMPDGDDVTMKRRLTSIRRSNHTRFVFVGRLHEDKGVRILLETIRRHRRSEAVQLDLYGAIADPTLLDDLPFNAAYRGVFDPGMAKALIARYDALVLPTWWQGEGYPGVLLEAFSVGVPVICTDWRSIAEIMPEFPWTRVKVRDIEALSTALELFMSHPEQVRDQIAMQYEELSKLEKRMWETAFLEWCRKDMSEEVA